MNLIVGPMAWEFARQGGTAHVEQANFFAEPFVTRRMAFLSEFGRVLAARGVRVGAKGKGLFQLVGLKLSTALVGRPEVLGSHVVNVLGQPHFAYTYRLKPSLGPALIARKYSVILAPPESDCAFEFVFTAGFPGDYRSFIRRIGRAEAMVRSFRFVPGS